MRSAATAALAGAVLGSASAFVAFAGSGVVLVPWGLTGAAVGWCSRDRRRAWTAGATYGLALTVSFLVASYDGHARVVAFVAFVVALGAFGAACGCLLAVLGVAVRQRREAHALH